MTFGPPVISVDVEDWFQSTWDRELPVSAGAERNTDAMLQLLSEAKVTSTMFVLGKFADAFPDAVRRIQREGHEIACHGWGHVEIFKQTRPEFVDDVRKAKTLLEDITGTAVRGYRAPDFSIVRDTLWALDELADLGFDYDSSIFPVRAARYGIPEWPTEPRSVRLENGRTLVELPIATLRLGNRRIPVGGGGYHRLLPGSVARAAARRVMRSGPFVFYCHPYETNARELRDGPVPIPLKVRLHQGIGRGRFGPRLRAFLADFGGRSFASMLHENTWPELDVPSLFTERAPDRNASN